MVYLYLRWDLPVCCIIAFIIFASLRTLYSFTVPLWFGSLFPIQPDSTVACPFPMHTRLRYFTPLYPALIPSPLHGFPSPIAIYNIAFTTYTAPHTTCAVVLPLTCLPCPFLSPSFQHMSSSHALDLPLWDIVDLYLLCYACACCPLEDFPFLCPCPSSNTLLHCCHLQFPSYSCSVHYRIMEVCLLCLLLPH